MKNKRDIFDSLEVMRDSYKSKYAEIMNDYNKELKRIKLNYNSEAPLFKEVTDKANNDMNTKLADLRNEAKNFIGGEIEQIKAVIDAEITVLPTNETVVNNLQRLYDLPLSRCEIEALAKRYDNSNYWVSKIVHDLAEKNGVTLPTKQASAQVMYDVLDNISDRVDIFLDEWKGEKDSSYSAMASLADSQLIKLERTFTNNFEDAEISTFKNVQIALRDIAEHRDLFSQARFLKTLYDNTNDLEKKYLLYEIDNTSSIYRDAIRSANLDYILETFVNSKDYKEIDNAKRTADKLRMEPDAKHEDIVNQIKANGGYSSYMATSLYDLYGKNNDEVNKALEVFTMTPDEKKEKEMQEYHLKKAEENKELLNRLNSLQESYHEAE